MLIYKLLSRLFQPVKTRSGLYFLFPSCKTPIKGVDSTQIMANANRELMMAKIKGLSITLIQSPSAAATVVILIISLGFLSLVAGEFETFLPIGAISIFVFLFLLTFKSDTLRDNKYLIANKRLELEQEKDKPLMETIEGEIVQPILEQPKKELKKKRK